MLIKNFFLFRWSSNISSYGRQISGNFGVYILLKYVTWAILWLFCTFLFVAYIDIPWRTHIYYWGQFAKKFYNSNDPLCLSFKIFRQDVMKAKKKTNKQKKDKRKKRSLVTMKQRHITNNNMVPYLYRFRLNVFIF